MSLIDQAKQCHGVEVDWSFGGGTALMLQISHRNSYDVDIFLGDPQYIKLLNPEIQDYVFNMEPSGIWTSGHHALKLAFDRVGEIDFICAPHILEAPTRSVDILGATVALETPFEIVAKKIAYRGRHIQPRDLFDIAAVARACGRDSLIGSLGQSSLDVEQALASAQRMKPEFAASIIGQLALQPDFQGLVHDAWTQCVAILTDACHGQATPDPDDPGCGA